MGKAARRTSRASPTPTGLLTTIEELGSTPARTVYIGDSRATSTWPATPAAMRSVWTGAITTRPIFAAEGWEPDLLVSDPEQILLAPEV